MPGAALQRRPLFAARLKDRNRTSFFRIYDHRHVVNETKCLTHLSYPD
jgi:hypothetical protein